MEAVIVQPHNLTANVFLNQPKLSQKARVENFYSKSGNLAPPEARNAGGRMMVAYSIALPIVVHQHIISVAAFGEGD